VVEIDDETLLAGIAAGSERAFEQFLLRHVDSIHGYTLRLTGSRDDADELTQETFLRVWQRAGSYQPGRVQVTTWLHTIAHHLCVDRWRKPAAEPHEDTDHVPDPAPGPAGALERSRLAARLDSRLIRRLRYCWSKCAVCRCAMLRWCLGARWKRRSHVWREHAGRCAVFWKRHE
jgi:RNA polymerase sigma-70 factor (ECF subfamily)